MEIIKSCENCVHNVPPMCTGKACGICDAASLKLWRPNYQTLEAELKQYMDLNALIKEAHQTAIEKGWWEGERNIGMLIALMHSELSEALEDYRNGRGMTEIYYECKESDPSDCLSRDTKADCLGCRYGKPCGIPIELADVCIRIFDFCGAYNIDLERAIKLKMAFNKTRPYRHGGKRV